MTMFLQIAVSVIFFTNKTLVLADKKSGWLVGVVAATLATFYFFRIELYIYTVLELGLIVLMGYGFLWAGQKKPLTEMVINWTTAIAMLVMTIFVFTGLMTAVEFGSSVALLLGTYFLTHNQISWGWSLYALAHGLAAYLGYHKDQQIFADFQVASGIVSLVGLLKTR